ncbi:MAG TPA: efflux RND transporter periplasmic adaptor subunit [Allosphingosinicella sp.]|jgi:RND family efflux transporter MFP subunit
MDRLSDTALYASAAQDRALNGERPRWARAALVAGPLALIGGVIALWDGNAILAAEPTTPSVTVALPLERRVNQWDDYVGRFEASRAVEVRPRVSGQIVGVHFTDGAVVRQGQLLFTIDPRPFNAALGEAVAGVASARSELALAETNLARARRLLADEAVSPSSVDQLSAQLLSARAALAAAQARVRARALDVEFTQIRAPISGRISDSMIDPGNLVTGGDNNGTMLTTINALDPIHFTFDVPESLHLKAARRMRSGQPAPVAEIRLQDEAGYNWRGRLDFIDNGISQNSGTIRARVVVRNPGFFLTPGMFGNMRLPDGGAAMALLVPDSAIRTDQARKVLLVAGPGNIVVARPVETGPLLGALRIIRSGVAPSDRVIIRGVQFAVAGAKVSPRLVRIPDGAGAALPSGASLAPRASEATLAAN